MNTNRDEGVIKFKLTLKRAPAPEMNQVIALEKWRALFFKLALIGEYPIDKIGYGNLSSRIGKKTFIITGSQTGHLAHLQAHHYSKVIECDLKKGSVTAEGLIPPSSESLTHYGMYEANPNINYVFHVHHQKLWEMMCNGPFDYISDDVPYGTQAMAEAASQLMGTKTSGIFVMKGHEDGIISYGATPEEAGKIILELYRKLAVRQ
ncbi:class II aldolase/adducin family protein [Peredibacter starrii]|uniref:Class II aldolase/adducin family protein n=1 Tax=Peredibacter starrii TaxID=28202 RepID=A0AAX4HRI1_9BACT|nr:class II aldolase/adducin family protein [Peredibacter starrii]WPU65965.1 class II aldolase/adducin family protein [Peredibacter starrii]